MEIEQRAASVSSREELVAFLGAFEQDFRANGTTWENATLESFLEAMAGWAQDMDGAYANRGERVEDQNPWRVMADLLMAARIYE